MFLLNWYVSYFLEKELGRILALDFLKLFLEERGKSLPHSVHSLYNTCCNKNFSKMKNGSVYCQFDTDREREHCIMQMNNDIL